METEEITPKISTMEPKGISKRLFFPNLPFLTVIPPPASRARMEQERGPPPMGFFDTQERHRISRHKVFGGWFVVTVEEEEERGS